MRCVPFIILFRYPWGIAPSHYREKYPNDLPSLSSGHLLRSSCLSSFSLFVFFIFGAHGYSFLSVSKLGRTMKFYWQTKKNAKPPTQEFPT